jgi:hypothetical protein
MRFADCLDDRWESSALAVEFLFMGALIGGYGRIQGKFTEINHDLGYARNSGTNQAPQLNPGSGRYQQDAIPIRD